MVLRDDDQAFEAAVPAGADDLVYVERRGGEEIRVFVAVSPLAVGVGVQPPVDDTVELRAVGEAVAQRRPRDGSRADRGERAVGKGEEGEDEGDCASVHVRSFPFRMWVSDLPVIIAYGRAVCLAAELPGFQGGGAHRISYTRTSPAGMTSAKAPFVSDTSLPSTSSRTAVPKPSGVWTWSNESWE